MSRSNSGRRPTADANSIEAKYLMPTVGPALIRGLAEIVERRPNDPIEYLATFLYKQVNNTRAQQHKEDEAKQLEIEKQKAEEDKIHRAQLKKEIRALREREENERRQREAEEARRREAEELAKRHKEMAAAVPPSLPAVREEEDDVFNVEFGETELHRQAVIENANLSKLLRENYHSIASRNAQGKTPRDLALDAGQQKNAEEIDNYCVELLHSGNTKAIQDLLLCGYTELIPHLKTTDDTNEDTVNFVNHEIPQLLEKLKQLKRAIKDGDMTTIESLVTERKNLGLYRDPDGSSCLHDAIENRHLEIAGYLLQRYPSLAHAKDVRGRTSLDLLSAIDEDGLADEQREIYDQLKEAFQTAATNREEH